MNKDEMIKEVAEGLWWFLNAPTYNFDGTEEGFIQAKNALQKYESHYGPVREVIIEKYNLNGDIRFTPEQVNFEAFGL